MTDTLPADSEELEPAVTFDSARLIAQVRRGDEAAIAEAYRITFGSHLGRVVLLHTLATLGEIGKPRAFETADQSNHTNGRGYVALEIARLAGFDHVAISAAGLTQELEGASYDRRHGHHHHHDGQPIVDFGDDHGHDGHGFDGGANDGSDFDQGGPVGD